jgi:hypothetical protein
MTVYPMNSLPDYEPTDLDLVPLSPAQIDAAIVQSYLVQDPEKRWPVYLNALALAGFEQWLHQRATTIQLDVSQCRIIEPPTARATTAVYHLQANGLKICLVAIESSPNQVVTLPNMACDRPELVAQFYIPISIYEELEQVKIHGFLRYDELIQQRQQQRLETTASGSYWIPMDWFEPDLDRLLLYLSCLEPAAIPLPNVVAAGVPLRQLLLQPVINAGRWIQQQVGQQLDDLSLTIGESLNWQLLPSMGMAGGIRDTLSTTNLDPATDEFSRILTALIRGGLPALDQARTVYRDFQLGGQTLRLYVMIAPIGGESASPEWLMLTILKHPTNQSLVIGTALQIADGNGVVVAQSAIASADVDYLYSSVIGTHDEQLVTIVTLADGNAVTFPAFTFQIAN